MARVSSVAPLALKRKHYPDGCIATRYHAGMTGDGTWKELPCQELGAPAKASPNPQRERTTRKRDEKRCITIALPVGQFAILLASDSEL